MASPRPRLRSLRAAPLALALLLGGCISLEPKYVRPAPPVPAALPQGGAYGAAEPVQVAAPDLAWRDFFTDPKLRAITQLALDNNRDLRVAILNIAEARQQYRIQRAALLPHIDANADATYEHIPASVLGATSGVAATSVAGTTGTTVASATSTSSSVFIREYEATLGVSNYELDLWGRVRSLTRQALEQYLSTDAAKRATQISLISQVATDYVTYAADLERLNTAKDTVKADTTSLQLTQARFSGGVASELDVRQAQTALEQARADVATYTTTLAQDANAETLLVGAAIPPDLLPGPLDDNFASLADLPAGVSSAVLLRRPDVEEAEHTLRGYNANIGAARAAFFPTVELTGSGGSTSLSFANLFGGATGSWSFTPAITLPIFDAGINAANLRLAKTQRDVAVAQYEKAIQTAFREVADALAQRGQIGELVAANQAYAFATGRSLTLSNARYQRGSDTYLNTLTAQLNTYSAQQALVTARLTRATNLITLYQTLGGGGVR
ncbi:efflux transporter outer membrane subunit [Caulobacter sp. S45]|uniref:efflux transporter outer membrane subunit n=1 Tax=Caulobacter sp. S45 TaxID=1641861 RepID=UPI0020C6CBED|nr:efflux transporter outer membrane subunit [Caulobacter sp. S45]